MLFGGRRGLVHGPIMSEAGRSRNFRSHRDPPWSGRLQLAGRPWRTNGRAVTRGDYSSRRLAGQYGDDATIISGPERETRRRAEEENINTRF